MASATVPSVTPAIPLTLKHIFFITDLEEASRRALPYVIALATRYKSEVTLIHSLGPIPYSPIPFEPVPPLDERPRQLVLPQMEDQRKECIANGISARSVLMDGDLISVVDAEMAKLPADLVVLGTHSHGAFYRMCAGSHAEQLVRHTGCSVLMVGKHATGAARWRERIGRILLATNFEEGSRHAMNFIAPVAAEHDSEVTVLHVVTEPVGVPLDAAELISLKSRKDIADIVAESALPKRPRIEIAFGPATEEIVRYANLNDSDLIVMGRRKAGALADHKPSTTLLSVAAEARCPVLTFC